MFRNKLKKVVGFGLALCIMGTLLISAPVTVMAEATYDIAPFGIIVPDDNDED